MDTASLCARCETRSVPWEPPSSGPLCALLGQHTQPGIGSALSEHLRALHAERDLGEIRP